MLLLLHLFLSSNNVFIFNTLNDMYYFLLSVSLSHVCFIMIQHDPFSSKWHDFLIIHGWIKLLYEYTFSSTHSLIKLEAGWRSNNDVSANAPFSADQVFHVKTRSNVAEPHAASILSLMRIDHVDFHTDWINLNSHHQCIRIAVSSKPCLHLLSFLNTYFLLKKYLPIEENDFGFG